VVLDSKKGDAVITIGANDALAAVPAVVRIVVEVKDKKMSPKQIHEELAAARENRNARVALMVFSEASAPADYDPFKITQDGVFCVVDPLAPDRAILVAAYRLARFLAVSRATVEGSGADLSVVNDSIQGIRTRMESVKEIKKTLGSIDTLTEKVRGQLDALRIEIDSNIVEIETQVRASVKGAVRL
jgi:hypothetical protein